MVLREALRLVVETRPWSDERHVAREDVEELRQLVEARLPEDAADAGDRAGAIELVQPVRVRRGIVRQRGRDVAAVLLLIRVDGHRAELQDQ